MMKRYSLTLAASPGIRDAEIQVLNAMAAIGEIEPLPRAGGHDEMVFRARADSTAVKALDLTARDFGVPGLVEKPDHSPDYLEV